MKRSGAPTPENARKESRTEEEAKAEKARVDLASTESMGAGDDAAPGDGKKEEAPVNAANVEAPKEEEEEWPLDQDHTVAEHLGQVIEFMLGDFACGGAAPPGTPGVAVPPLAPVSLPLTKESALTLTTAARLYLGRRRSRKGAWQLAAGQFQLSGAEWNASVMPAVLARVATEMGCGSSSVQAELRRLVLFEEGQHLAPTRDEAQSPRMFGTLVVMLPSVYTGGALRITHGTSERVFDFAAANRFGVHYAAFHVTACARCAKWRADSDCASSTTCW